MDYHSSPSPLRFKAQLSGNMVSSKLSAPFFSWEKSQLRSMASLLKTHLRCKPLLDAWLVAVFQSFGEIASRCAGDGAQAAFNGVDAVSSRYGQPHARGEEHEKEGGSGRPPVGQSPRAFTGRGRKSQEKNGRN